MEIKTIEDMVSIDQSDPQKIEDGIYGIGGFLNVTFAHSTGVVGEGQNCVARWVFQTFFMFSSNPGETIQFDEHMFQMGWFNDQLDCLRY